MVSYVYSQVHELKFPLGLPLTWLHHEFLKNINFTMDDQKKPFGFVSPFFFTCLSFRAYFGMWACNPLVLCIVARKDLNCTFVPMNVLVGLVLPVGW